jgi:hypothetical protein
MKVEYYINAARKRKVKIDLHAQSSELTHTCTEVEGKTGWQGNKEGERIEMMKEGVGNEQAKM